MATNEPPPDPIRCATTCSKHRNVPTTLSRSTASKSESSIRSSGRSRPEPPALATNPSIAPASSRGSRTARATEASSVMSVTTECTRAPWDAPAASSSRVASSEAAVRPQIATDAPSSTRSWAQVRSSPVAPPVTMYDRPPMPRPSAFASVMPPRLPAATDRPFPPIGSSRARHRSPRHRRRRHHDEPAPRRAVGRRDRDRRHHDRGGRLHPRPARAVPGGARARRHRLCRDPGHRERAPALHR